jgi:hypothetical protein
MNYSKLKFLCTEKKLPLSHLATSLDFTEAGFYSMIKNDTMKVRTLEKVAAILKVSPCVFFDPGEIDLNNMVNEAAPAYTGNKTNIIIETQNRVIELLTNELEQCRARLK